MHALLTAKELSDLFQVTREHIWRRVKAGTLPAPIYPAPRSPRWHRHEIEAVIETASAARAA